MKSQICQFTVVALVVIGVVFQCQVSRADAGGSRGPYEDTSLQKKNDCLKERAKNLSACNGITYGSKTGLNLLDGDDCEVCGGFWYENSCYTIFGSSDFVGCLKNQCRARAGEIYRACLQAGN